jgi:tetrahydromethanopterin S-methyltransferase subunit B
VDKELAAEQRALAVNMTGGGDGLGVHSILTGWIVTAVNTGWETLTPNVYADYKELAVAIAVVLMCKNADLYEKFTAAVVAAGAQAGPDVAKLSLEEITEHAHFLHEAYVNKVMHMLQREITTQYGFRKRSSLSQTAGNAKKTAWHIDDMLDEMAEMAQRIDDVKVSLGMVKAAVFKQTTHNTRAVSADTTRVSTYGDNVRSDAGRSVPRAELPEDLDVALQAITVCNKNRGSHRGVNAVFKTIKAQRVLYEVLCGVEDARRLAGPPRVAVPAPRPPHEAVALTTEELARLHAAAPSTAGATAVPMDVDS